MQEYLVKIKILIVLIGLLFGLNSKIEAFEIKEDRFVHASIGFMVGTISTKWMDSQYTAWDFSLSKIEANEKFCLIKRCKEKDFWYYAVPVLSVFSYAIIKELTDEYFDFTDLVYSVAGGVAGITLISF